MDPYETLASAVVLRAVEDYRLLFRRLKRKPDDRIAAAELRRLVRFFRGEWFRVLCNLDPEALLTKVTQEENARPVRSRHPKSQCHARKC